jgi:uncharacterized protein YaaN involved in tellurite resistance
VAGGPNSEEPSIDETIQEVINTGEEINKMYESINNNFDSFINKIYTLLNNNGNNSQYFDSLQ